MSGRSANPPDRLLQLKGHIEALKQRIIGLRQAKEDDIDWESYGRDTNTTFEFNIRRQLRGHFGKVYALDFANDNITLLTAGQDGKLIVWNAFTENKKHVITLKSSWVMGCAFEKEEAQLVASGGLDNVCTVYDLRTPARPAFELIGHDGYVSSCKFAGKGTIATSSGDSTVCLWDVEKAARTATFADHSADVMSVAVHPYDPHLFASGSCDATVRIWDSRASHLAGNSCCVRTFSGHVSDVNAVEFFPSGNCVGSGSDDSTARIWDLRSCGPINVLTEDRLLYGLTGITFSRSGRLLFASYDEPIVIAWETTSKDGTYHELKGHRSRVSCVGINTSGHALASGSWDMDIGIWA
jgi:guanine nucleotide-binding protein G(I)/G(S)/G(T) subunit beta-1